MTGYFGVAIYHPVTEANVGTLWRSTKTYRGSVISTVGRRYQRQSSDTCKTPQTVPLLHYADMDDLIAHLPDGCALVGIEMHARSTPLPRFAHPSRALYLLGAEDHGLPDQVLDRCHHVVAIPSPEPWSLNVAVAGTLVLADRYGKEQARLAAAA